MNNFKTRGDDALNLIGAFIKKHLLDITVISLILLFAISFVALSGLFRTEGAYIRIELDGELYREIPLSVDGVYSLGGGSNVLTVEGGEAFMSYSDCPDHTCENTGRVKFVGQTIVCLPNRLSITIIGESDDGVDFIS